MFKKELGLRFVFRCGILTYSRFCYRPQTKFGQGNIFTPVCHSVHRGGVCGCSGGHAWLLRGGVHGCSGGVCMVAPGGHAWLLQGACVVAPGGMRGFIWGGMHGFIQGGHAWFYSGGHAWFFQFFRTQWDTVNERAVRILLECILVLNISPHYFTCWRSDKQEKVPFVL